MFDTYFPPSFFGEPFYVGSNIFFRARWDLLPETEGGMSAVSVLPMDGWVLYGNMVSSA